MTDKMPDAIDQDMAPAPAEQIRRRAGARVHATRQEAVAQTAVYASLDEGADADVARIINANLGAR